MSWLTTTMMRLRSVLFGEGGPGPEAGHGVLQGILPWGQAPRRGTRELLQAYQRLPFLHSLLRRIAEDVASTQWRVLAPGPKARERSWYKALANAPPTTDWHRTQARAQEIRRALAAGELQELEGHPFLALVETMNPALRGFDSWFVTQLHLELIGQAPLVRDNHPATGLPTALWPVAPHWVIQTPSMSHPYYRVSWNAWYREIAEKDLLWQLIPDPENPYARGTSFGPAVADELDVIELRARYAKNFFFNDGTPSAIISMENAPVPEVDRLRSDLESRHRGPGKNGLNYVTNRKLQYQQLQPPMKDLQYAEQTESGRDLLLEVLQFPRELVGLRDGTNRATISAATYLYSRGVLVPRIERRRGFLQPVLSEWDERLILAYVSPVPEDEEGERDYMKAVPSAFTMDEHRAQGGKPPLGGTEGAALFTPAPTMPQLGLSIGRSDPPWAWHNHGMPAPPAGNHTACRPGHEGFHCEQQPLFYSTCQRLHGGRKIMRPPLSRSVVNVLEALRPEALAEEVGPVEDEGFQAWAAGVLKELGVSVSFDMRNPKVRQLLSQYAGERIAAINETTQGALRQALSDSAAAGEGVREAKKRIEQVFDDASGARAEMIARTELGGLSNAANVEAFRQSGVVSGKEWLAVRDGNTRPEHAELDTETVGLDEDFTTAEGHSASHPGGFGVPELDINCRCTVLPVVADPERAVRRAVALSEEQKAATWKAYDTKRRNWEALLAEALRRGFLAQRQAVLTALEAAHGDI